MFIILLGLILGFSPVKPPTPLVILISPTVIGNEYPPDNTCLPSFPAKYTAIEYSAPATTSTGVFEQAPLIELDQVNSFHCLKLMVRLPFVWQYRYP